MYHQIKSKYLNISKTKFIKGILFLNVHLNNTNTLMYKKKGAFSSANAFSGSVFLKIEVQKIARKTINNVFSHTNPTQKQKTRRKWRKKHKIDLEAKLLLNK